MPLIVMCGIPGSGKTSKSLALKEYFETKHKITVHIINEESMSLQKNEAYGDSIREKQTRAFLKSNVEKSLSTESITIMDSMNYIKGYRYELYCLSRQYKTTQCVVFCKSSIDTARANNSLNAENNFCEFLFVDVGKRLEEPNPRNRWDSP
jgi:protein KTI12